MKEGNGAEIECSQPGELEVEEHLALRKLSTTPARSPFPNRDTSAENKSPAGQLSATWNIDLRQSPAGWNESPRFNWTIDLFSNCSKPRGRTALRWTHQHVRAA